MYKNPFFHKLNNKIKLVGDQILKRFDFRDRPAREFRSTKFCMILLRSFERCGFFFLYVLALVSRKLLICKGIHINNYFVKDLDRLKKLGRNFTNHDVKGITEYLTIIRVRLSEYFLIISETNSRVLFNIIFFFRGHGNESCNLIGPLRGPYFPLLFF